VAGRPERGGRQPREGDRLTGTPSASDRAPATGGRWAAGRRRLLPSLPSTSLWILHRTGRRWTGRRWAKRRRAKRRLPRIRAP